MIGAAIKRYRVENGLTQKDIAARLSVAQNTISQYEQGKRVPTINKLASIVALLGCAVEDLLRDNFNQ